MFFFNNTIANNFSDHGIPGVFNFSADLHFFNNILWNNFSDDISADDKALTWLSNPPDVQYCLVWEGRIDGINIITDDPLFANPSPEYGLGSNGWEYDWTLLDESPAINAGTPDTIGLSLPLFDLAGNPRIFGNRIEIGAYENQHVYVKIDNSPLSEEINLYPNPGTRYFHLQIDPGIKNCSFDLYNSQGKLIMHQLIENMNYDFPTENLPSGVYHYQIYNNNNVFKNSTWIKL